MSVLTVGLPVSRAMAYLPATIESLLGQTCGDFQVLAVVGDGRDGSLDYLFGLDDPRVQVIEKPDLTLSQTLNFMLERAETPWLVRQDADDIAYPQRIQRTLDYINRYPEAGMFAALAEYYPPQHSVGTFRASRGTPEELRAIVERGYLLSFCHPAVTLNIDHTRAAGGYRETLNRAEDADLWWRIARRAEIQIIPETLLGYRQHGGQATTLAMRENAIDLLYVQYLLLSELWSLPARPEHEIAGTLERMITMRDMVSQENLRALNIAAKDRKYVDAFACACQAVLSSPRYVLRRSLDELFASRTVVNGVDPKVFQRYRGELWPSV